MPQQRDVRTTNNSEFAIKPASHTTERHSTNCQMKPGHSHRDASLKNCNAYSGFNNEMRAKVAQPAKIYREPSEFETWRTKIDEVFHLP